MEAPRQPGTGAGLVAEDTALAGWLLSAQCHIGPGAQVLVVNPLADERPKLLQAKGRKAGALTARSGS